jgi:hypothetical protein
VIGPPDFHRDTHRCDVTSARVRVVGTPVRIPVWRSPWADR